MKKWLLIIAGIATILLGIIYISWPVGHIPPYDANLVRLAESELQGYCSGKVLWITGGTGDAKEARDCRKAYANRKSNKPDMSVVPRSFCQAVVDSGWNGGTVKDCIDILANYQYWPTYNGSLTNQWNRARPYPQAAVAFSGGKKSSGSRTGGHEGNTRTPPVHTVPGY